MPLKMCGIPWGTLIWGSFCANLALVQLWKLLVQKSVIANGSRRTNSFQLIMKTLMIIKEDLFATEDDSSILIKEKSEGQNIS